MESGSAVHNLYSLATALNSALEIQPEETPQWVLRLNDEQKKKLTETYKVKGNLAMKFKDYGKALQLYSRAIQAGCLDDNLMAVLHNNRSAAKFHLGDYWRALVDAKRAIAIREDYLKPRWRAAQCAYHLQRYEIAEKFCSETIAQIKDGTDAQQLLIRDEAKKLDMEIKKGFQNFQRLVDAVKTRRIKFSALKDGEPITEELLYPQGCPLDLVRFSDANSELLVWTASIHFIDMDYTAFVSMPEDAVLADILDSILPRLLPSDCPRRDEFCRSSKLNVYTPILGGGKERKPLHKINKNLTIKKILEDKNVYIQIGAIMMDVVLPGFSDGRKI